MSIERYAYGTEVERNIKEMLETISRPLQSFTPDVSTMTCCYNLPFS
jgi:hypothetical protein